MSDFSARPEFAIQTEILFQKLTFSHFVELLRLDDPLQRAFYELECMKGGWSVRELKRQIGSLLFERLGLSTDKEKLLRLTARFRKISKDGLLSVFNAPQSFVCKARLLMVTT